MRALALLLALCGCAATVTDNHSAPMLPRADVQGTWMHVEPEAPSAGGAVTVGDGFVILWSGCSVPFTDETATSARMLFTQCADEAGASFTVRAGTVALEHGAIILSVEGESGDHARRVLRFEEAP